MDDKRIYLIAGCDGAGKTTASFTILPDILNCREYVNATEIAKGLSPFQPENVHIQASKIMIIRINELIRKNQSFAFETTLSTRTYKNKIINARNNGYRITMLFFWLQNPELAKERVKTSVAEGGLDINPEIIEKRFYKGIKNLFKFYLPIVDHALIFDNSEGKHELIAESKADGIIDIINHEKYNLLRSYYDNN